VLRFSLFNIFPMFLELVFVLIILGYLYKYYFFCVTLGSVLLYLIATYCITNWRGKFFRRQNESDQVYNQKATDSLLNFETVKYFNAEKHERERFNKALQLYKIENVKTARSLVVLNLSQSFIVALGLLFNLGLANYLIIKD
jgi:ATP-binding cassette subfamily B protein